MKLADQYKNQYAWRHFTKAFDALGSIEEANILDVGCGTGNVISDLCKLGAHVDGIDANRELLECARASLSSKCSLKEADFDLPQMWPEGTYDLIWSSFAIAYSSDPVSTLRGWSSRLNQNGKLALIEMSGLLDHDPMTKEDQNTVKQFYAAAEAVGQYNFHAAENLEKWVEMAGYKIDSVIKLPDDELSFTGTAKQDVVTSWKHRLDRMPRLISMAESGFKERFVETLKSPSHTSRCVVKAIIAHFPN